MSGTFWISPRVWIRHACVSPVRNLIDKRMVVSPGCSFGGIISRWKFELDQGERDNSHFVLSRNNGEGMAEIFYEDPDNPPAPGRYHIHLRAVANDGTGMVIERPYTVWVLQSGQQNVAFDLDTTSQAGELPVLTTARPNRTH